MLPFLEVGEECDTPSVTIAAIVLNSNSLCISEA
jgi:hypothetical protein